MRKLEWFIVCTFLVTAAVSTAYAVPAKDSASAFNGTWRVDPAQTKFANKNKPDAFYIGQNWYHCTSCDPQWTVPADGADHSVANEPYDTMNVKVVDDHTIQVTAKKDGKVIGQQTRTVSKDGKQLMLKSTSYPQDGSAPISTEVTMKRVGVAPLGVHSTSGQWEPVKFTQSNNGLTFSYQVNGDEVTYSDPTGGSYSAKLDGTDAPAKGDYGMDAVSVKQLGPDTIEETDKRNGKVVGVSKITVHGNTMTIQNISQPSGRTSTYTAHKQK